MQKVIYTNSLGQSVSLANRPPYLLSSISGTGAPGVDIQLQKAPYQDGQTFVDALLEERVINLEVAIKETSKLALYQRRREISRIFNPKLGPGVLRYEYDGGALDISAVAESPPAFPIGRDARGPNFQRALITLMCPNPFWRDTAATKAEVAVWHGAFEFPLEIVAEGIELGFRELSLIANIYNPGDVACGMEIHFKALATVENPSLFNVNTRESLKLNRTMDAGEVLIITTYFANKRVESFKNGVTTNVFHYIDLESTFLQLEPGDNLLRYDADDGLDNLEVDIYFNPQYAGV